MHFIAQILCLYQKPKMCHNDLRNGYDSNHRFINQISS